MFLRNKRNLNCSNVVVVVVVVVDDDDDDDNGDDDKVKEKKFTCNSHSHCSINLLPVKVIGRYFCRMSLNIEIYSNSWWSFVVSRDTE